MNIKQLIEKLKQFDENLPVCIADDTEIFELDEFYGFDVFEGEYTAVRTDRKMISSYISGRFLVLNNIGDTDLEQSDLEHVVDNNRSDEQIHQNRTMNDLMRCFSVGGFDVLNYK